MDNGWAALIVLLLGDLHLLDGGKRSKDGASNPDRVIPLCGSNNLDLDCGWSKGSDFLQHKVGNSGVHGSSSRHDSVGIKILTAINITLYDGVVGGLMDTTGFHSKEGRLEECFRAAEMLITNIPT